MAVKQSKPRVYEEPYSAERRISFGLASVVWLAVGIGLCVNAIAVAEATRDKEGIAQGLFWISLIAPFIVLTIVLLANKPSARLRQVTVGLVGVYPTLIYRLTSPLVLSSYDEHLHERELADLLHGSGLFAPNPMLSVGPYYPGLELFTGAIVRLTGMSAVAAMNVVPLLCRLLLVLAIYFIAVTLLRSERAASLVVVLYATSPQFFLFNSMFSYQTIALTLGMGGVLLLRRAQFKTGMAARRLTVLAMLVFAALVIAHHLTSWIFWGFLLVWAMTSPRDRRKVVVQATVVMGATIAIWTAAIASQLSGYLGPVFSAALQEAVGTLGGSSKGQVFSNKSGYVTPEWQKTILLLYAVLCTIAALAYGSIVLLRAIRSRNPPFALIALLTLSYPATLAAHFVPAAADIGDRASTFLFLPLTLCCSYVVMNIQRSRRSPASRTSSRVIVMLIAFTSVAYVGGIILGSGPSDLLLPGPYQIDAAGRSQDPLTLASVRWAATHIPPGSRIIADVVPSELLSSQGQLWPIIQTTNDLSPADIYFSTTWGSYQTKVVKGLDIGYIYVDQRLETGWPGDGAYFYQGETPNGERITAADISKFAHVPGLKRIYHLGSVTIYSTAGFGVAQVHTGFAGDRSMGLGTVGDFVLGLLLVALIFALRSRLGWLASSARDADAVGIAVAVMGTTILLAAVLFGVRSMPGPSFSVGIICSVVAIMAVSRLRGRPVHLPRISLDWKMEPLAILGFLIGMAAIVLTVHEIWNVDVAQVDALLKSAAARP